MKLTEVSDKFTKNGFIDLSNFALLDRSKCKVMLNQIQNSRVFSKEVFVDPPKSLDDLTYKGVNPEADRNNFLLNIDDHFILENENLKQFLYQTLGSEYSVLLKKVVCGLPDTSIPDWVIQAVENKPVPNLGAYIKPQYRDLTYFRGIDWHQDVIDYPGRDSRFVTLYIYLHDVGENDSPLWVVPGSHGLGPTKFPHQLHSSSEDYIDYYDDSGEKYLRLKPIALTGSVGSAYIWHSTLLHGTTNVSSSKPRISLRYLIAKNSANKSEETLVDKLMEMSGKEGFSPLIIRDDLDSKGKSINTTGKLIEGFVSGTYTK